MPIDDALEDIQQNKENTQNDKKIFVDTDSEVFELGKNILGKYLAEEVFCNKRYNKIKEFLKTWGPCLLTCTSIGEDEIDYNIKEKTDKEMFLKIAKTICEGYLLKTDYAKNIENEISKEELNKYIPEMHAVKELIAEEHFKTTIITPYQFVMGMQVKYRFFAALCVEKALKKKEISLKQNVKKRKPLYEYIPNLSTIAETAKEYQVTEIKEMLENFNSVIEEYIAEWGAY